MQLGKLWRNRWLLLRWGVFLLALAAVAAGLYLMLPPEPRWVLAGSPKIVFDAGDGHIATCTSSEGGATGPLQLWDAATGQEIARFLNGEEPFEARGHGKDGRTFVAVVKGEAGVWRICGLDLAERREWHADVHAGPFASMAFSPRCDFLALQTKPADDAASCAIIETSSGHTVARLPGKPDQWMFGGDGACLVADDHDEAGKRKIRVTSNRTGTTTVIDDASLVGVSPDSRWIIGDRGEHGVWLWDVDRSRWHAKLAEAKAPPAPKENAANALAVDRGFAFLATRYRLHAAHGRGVVRLWSARGLRQRFYALDLWAMADDGRTFSPDSRLVLCTAYPETGPLQWKLHDVETGKQLWERSWQQNSAEHLFTPDSRRIVAVVPDAGRMEIIDAATGETERTISPVDLDGPSAGLSRDGRTVVVAAAPPDREPPWILTKIEEWLMPRTDTSPMVIRAYDVETGAALGELLTQETDEHWLTEDRQTLVTVTSENNDNGVVATTIRGWDMPPRKPLRWVVGVPSSLGVGLLLLHFGWRRLRRQKVAAKALPKAQG